MSAHRVNQSRSQKKAAPPWDRIAYYLTYGNQVIGFLLSAAGMR